MHESANLFIFDLGVVDQGVNERHGRDTGTILADYNNTLV